MRRKKGSKVPDCVVPRKRDKGRTYAQSVDYKYLEGHVVPEIAEQLPVKSVGCWYKSYTMALPACAVRKFVKKESYCKRCSLFQKDEYSQELRSLIEKWEQDDLELEE